MIRFRKKFILWFMVLITCELNSAANFNNSNVMKINSSDSVGKTKLPRPLLKYNNKENITTSNFDKSYIPYDLQIVIDAVSKLNNSQCGLDAFRVIQAIAKKEKWALEMFDASSKFPIGILSGEFYQFGNFDECINVQQDNLESEELPIQGQYCLANVELFNNEKIPDGALLKSKPRNMFNSTIYWAVCLPSTCTTQEVEVLLKEIFTLATNHNDISVYVNQDKCYVQQVQPLSKLEILYGCVVGLFFVFITLASVFHYYNIQQRKKKYAYNIETARESNRSTSKEIIYCFSAIQTISKFLQTKPSSLNLECICGIKFISMLFIIVGHSLLFMVGGPVLNTSFYDKESLNLANAIFVNSPLLVDTFLTISGFLMCYLLIIELDKRKGKVNFLVLYIARYIRLTPSYLVVLGLYCSFLFRMGDGPLWNSRIKQEQERCLQSWWSNLLYVNNYVNTEYMCMFQSWYLAVDYHLFIIAPFIIYPLWKWQRFGKALLGFCIIGSAAVPFWITFKNKLDPTFMAYAPEILDLSENYYFKTAYVKTHMRASSYFLGILFGYIVYRLQTKGTKIPNYVIIFGWALSAIGSTLSMFSIVVFFSPNHGYSATESAIYASLHRVAWCISIGWILLVCMTDNSTIVNRFLSWKPFIPLSRLTYCAYLVNGVIEVFALGSQRSGTYMSRFELANKALAHGILTFVAAFVLCILFESPIHGLEKILLQKATVKKSRNNNIMKQNRSTDDDSI